MFVVSTNTTSENDFHFFFCKDLKKCNTFKSSPFFSHYLNSTANPAHLAALLLPFWLYPQKGLI